MKAIQTNVAGWEQQCLESANTKEQFEIHGIQTRHHLSFCVKLCLAYKLKAVQAKTTATFTPLFQ